MCITGTVRLCIADSLQKRSEMNSFILLNTGGWCFSFACFGFERTWRHCTKNCRKWFESNAEPIHALCSYSYSHGKFVLLGPISGFMEARGAGGGG